MTERLRDAPAPASPPPDRAPRRLRRIARAVVALPRGQRLLGGVLLIVLLADLGFVYQRTVGVNRAPRYSRGGAYQRQPLERLTTGLILPSAAPAGDELALPSPRPTARSTSRAVLRGGTPRPGPTAQPAVPAFPSLGVYVFDVDGTESSTGFGTRRYPSRMTLEVHRPSDIRADEAVFDLDFQYGGQGGANHSEREIVAYRPDGLSFTFESGTICFNFCRSSEGSYDPAMTQIPLPLAQGVQRTGRSRAVSRSGATTRTEQWSARVVGRETVTILGQPIETWVVAVHRESEPGASEEVKPRDRTYWYDPARRIWVKWHERFHGQQNMGVTFTYDTEYTATLAGFQPR